MSLKGNIETFNLASILQLLSGDKKTGILTIAEKGRLAKVYFKNGSIIHAVGNQKEVRLGYLLRAKGIISAQELQKALTLAKHKQERLGKILVEKGYISLDTLKKFLHQQVRDILYDLFLWPQGDFEYVDQEISVDAEFSTELNHMEIILEGTRRVDEWAILKKNIPHPQVVFKINRSVEQQKSSVNLTANEWRVISLVDGKRSVQQIIVDSGHDEFVVYRVINSLISSGIIEKSESGPTAAPGDRNESSIIIQIYHEVLQNMRKISEKAVGTQALPLLQEAKNQLPDHQLELLRTYDCSKDAKTNIHRMLQSAADSAPGKEAILNSFNAWILVILHKQTEVLNEKEMTASIQALIKPGAAWQKLPVKPQLKGTILSAINQTVEQFQQEALQAVGGKEKAGGILSFLKRK
ncbi:MAG: DUF4388 domain-containing protein [Deltaproteobacteria bacterium]|nr:MAG: DUF4388 domain-containing protein [Deltaproteobacteria bacterium]